MIAELLDPDLKEWPDEVERRYERFEILGKGSFGLVWMSRRVAEPVDEFDDEFVAIKEIKIKDDKSEVYAEREISILKELRHPNIIRLIGAYPVYNGSRVVVMQLARGPNVHQLVIKRGALGLPLARLVSRQLIAAVSYMHGRAVIHRDIKPSNVILACNTIPPIKDYDWSEDDAIWSSKEDGEEAVRSNKWKVMLVDFGFARALEKEEIDAQSRHLRNSIVYETSAVKKSPSRNRNLREKTIPEDDGSIGSDLEALATLAETAALSMRHTAFEATNDEENAIMGDGGARKRQSGVSMQLPNRPPKSPMRSSTARHKVRSMSALGTKAYAAPEIRKKLRHKTEEDFEKDNAAMTECVADYGMIVDAYSVGWTLRVAITGVPPNFTISEYMRERDTVVLGDADEDVPTSACCCFPGSVKHRVRVRDPSMIPHDATLLIASMTEKKPEDRMTVREAQNEPYIAGGPGEDSYQPPQGDFPTKHGDPVVPLNCAASLSKLTIRYHMS